jgi:hypothetical protein
MKIRTVVAVMVFVALALGVRQTVRGEEPAPAQAKVAMTESVYACPACHGMALKAGKCAGCGQELKQMHLLSVKGGEALLCGCGPSCKCNAAGMKDGKCACGKEVVKVSAKGYWYADDQGCPVLSDQPGKCMCGKKLRKIE